MLYLHRGMIRAVITGGEMPKTPKSCPPYPPEAEMSVSLIQVII